MTVHELTRQELDELKENYYWEYVGEDEILGDVTWWTEIDDEVVLEHYDGIDFVKEDFWCNCA